MTATRALAFPLLALLLASSPARASVTLGGSSTYWQVDYGSCGTWWDGSSGIQIDDPHSSSSTAGWNDLLDGGSPWSQVSIEYSYGGTDYTYDNNDAAGTCDWTMTYEYADTSVAYHFFSAGVLDIMRYETLRLTWRITGSGGGTTTTIDRGVDLLVWYEVWNPTGTDVTDFQLMVGANPNPDLSWAGDATTINDVENWDTTDGWNDWAGAIGDSSLTYGFAPCEPSTATIGFASNETDPDGSFADPGGAAGDLSVHFLQEETTIPAGQAVSFGFIVGLGTDDAYTRSYAVDGAAGRMSFDYCECDNDADGFTGGQCGGADCDDNDATVNPGATEIWYDGVDQDCAEDNDYDVDGDGWASSSDCDDTDATVSPGATEVWYDGIDQDCDGANDYDADGDGFESDVHGGGDCDDGDADVNPAEADTWYDGVDSDCSGSDYDADGDGHDHADHGGDDCDDTDDDVYGGAPETWYDGVDSDCDGASDYDADGDGHDHEAFDGDDCDDTDPDVHPGAEELWYDGVDQDCDEATADDDADGDGHGRDEDCDDTDPTQWDGCEDGGDDTGVVVIEEDGGGEGGGADGLDDWKHRGGHGVCGCASTDPAKVPWGFVMLGALGVLVRRRRD